MRFSGSAYTQILVSTGAIIVIAIAMLLLGITPRLSALRETADALKQGRDELSRIRAEIASYQSLSAAFNQLSAERAALQQIFPAREELMISVEVLESAADQAGLVYSLALTDREAELDSRRQEARDFQMPGVAGLEAVPFVLTASGNYRNLLDFFLTLENSPHLIMITGLSLTADSVQNQALGTISNSGLFTGDIEGLLFMKKP